MRINITYKKNADVDAPCIAQTEVRGECIVAIGRTWENAKERLIEKLNSYLGATEPEPETVEVKVAGEEMDTEFFPFNAGQTRKSVTENEGDYQEFRNSPQYPDPVAWKKAKEAASRTIEAGKV